MTFFQFIMTYRGKLKADDKSKLAEWIFSDHDFPKYSNEYSEISDYLEWNTPFHNALIVFDELWELFVMNQK